jgi:hypothetical protein
MKQNRYWLRGLGIGILVYVVIVIVLVALTFNGVITCNEFITVGDPVKESFLCKPEIFLVALPFMILSELAEDISNGMMTHLGLYVGLLGGLVIYLGVCSFLGVWYGKIKNRKQLSAIK